MANADRITEMKRDIEELNRLKNITGRRFVVDLLSVEIKKLESQLLSLQKENSNEPPPSAAQPAQKTEPPVNKRYQVKLNGYGWDQSDKFIKIFVTLKNAHTLPTQNVFCNLTENSMELHVKDLDNKDYTLVINKLLEPINTETSHWKQKTDMVVVFLAKTNPGTHWSHVTEVEKRFDENKASKFKTDSMDSKNPQDSLMGLMRNMYEQGDDDMKRMINKAWVEGQEKQGLKPMDL